MADQNSDGLCRASIPLPSEPWESMRGLEAGISNAKAAAGSKLNTELRVTFGSTDV